MIVLKKEKEKKAHTYAKPSNVGQFTWAAVGNQTATLPSIILLNPNRSLWVATAIYIMKELSVSSFLITGLRTTLGQKSPTWYCTVILTWLDMSRYSRLQLPTMHLF